MRVVGRWRTETETVFVRAWRKHLVMSVCLATTAVSTQRTVIVAAVAVVSGFGSGGRAAATGRAIITLPTRAIIVVVNPPCLPDRHASQHP